MPAWIAYLVHASAAAIAYGIFTVRRRSGDERALKVFEIATAVVLAGALLALTSGPILIDFYKAYLYAGNAVLSQPSTLYDCNRGQCFVNLPIVALLFAPLAPLDPSIAGVAFSAAGAALLVAAVRRMARGRSADTIVWMALLSGPIYYSVRIGNTTHMLLLPLLMAFGRLADGSGAGGAGAILAALSLLKPPLALFLPYLVLRRHFRAAVAMSACAACIVAASIAWFGIDLHAFWFREFVINQGSRPIAAYNVQSVNGFLAHLLTRGHLRDWYPIDAGPRFSMLSAALSAALVAAVLFECWRAGSPKTSAAHHVELGMVLCLTVLVAPISWTHYDLLLLIPGAALVTRWASLEPRCRAGLAAALILIAPPVVVLSVQSRIGNALYERLLVSHYFAGAVVLLAVLMAERQRISKTTPEHSRLSAVTASNA
ncbi:MAG TPA: glycosyltransferase family 87 protein [Vicinamibacterales bacterium]|nr:glycosyltransferase family 87 protein [Vicinamibacterales bacterium]